VIAGRIFPSASILPKSTPKRGEPGTRRILAAPQETISIEAAMSGRRGKFRLGNMAKSMFGKNKPDEPSSQSKEPETTAFRKFEMPSINTDDMAEV
jgi:hypothetical protein